MHEPVAEGDLVGWKDPRAPKRGPQLARVRDVAGPWVLLEPEYGPRVGRRYWILYGKLVLSMLPQSDPAQQTKAFLKSAGILPLEEGDPELLPELASPAWLDCRVCKQPLQRLQRKDPTTKVTSGVEKWRYCEACDRMQRIP
ncbi:MAG: hypothetical protein ACYC2H_10395 [Thermoplasmatota archaeon]